MKRLMIYFFYDKDGIVDDYIPYFLKSFKPFCEKICVVVNGLLTNDSKKVLKEIANKQYLLSKYVDNIINTLLNKKPPPPIKKQQAVKLFLKYCQSFTDVTTHFIHLYKHYKNVKKLLSKIIK